MTSQGWHSRALQTPHPDPYSFTPTPESLILTVLLNAQSDPQGISLAFFADTERIIVVDALGRISLVEPSDFDGIRSLANRALALPDAGSWMNTWVVKRGFTCQPNHRIFISPQEQLTNTNTTPRSLSNLKQIGVQGFSETTKELCYPINGYLELPYELWELTGLLLEARAGAGWPGEGRDDIVLDKLRSVVDPLF